MRRILATTAILLVGSSLLLALLAAGVTQGWWLRDWLRVRVERELGATLEEPVSIEAIDGVLHREIRVRGLRIGGAAAAEAADASLVVGRIRLEWGALGKALSGDWNIAQLDISNVDLALRPSREGTDWPRDAWRAKFDRDPQDTSPPSRVRVRIDRLAIEDARLRLLERDAAATELGLSARARGIGFARAASVSASGERLDESALHSSVEEAKVEFDLLRPLRGKGKSGGADALARIAGHAEFRFDGSTWQLAGAHAEGPLLTLDARGAGNAAGLDAAEVTLRVASIQQLSRLFADAPLALDGALEVDARGEGAYAWPLGRIALRARDLKTEALALGDLRFDAKSLAAGRLEVEAVRYENGPIELESDATARLSLDDKTGQLDALALRRKHGRGTLRIDAVVPVEFGSGVPSPDRNPATQLHVEMDRWPLEALEPLLAYQGFEAGGNLSLDVVAKGSAEGWRLLGDARLDAGRFAQAEWRAEGARFELEIDGPLLRPKLAGSGQVDRLSWRATELGALELRARNETLVADADASPGAGFAGSIVRLDGQLESPRAAKGGDRRGVLRFDAALPVDPGDAAAPIERHPRTRIAVDVIGWPLETLAPLVPEPATGIGGVFDAGLVASGTPAGLEVRGKARVADAALAYEQWRAAGAVIDVAIDGALERPRLSGTTSIDQLQYATFELGRLDLEADVIDFSTLEIAAFRLQGGLVPLQLEAPTRMQFESSLVRFDETRLESEGQRIRVSGGVSPMAADSFRVEWSAIDVGRTAALLRDLGFGPVEIDSSGRLDGFLVWDGPRTNPVLGGEAHWSGARIGEFDFQNVDAYAETEGDALAIRSDWIREGVSVLNWKARVARQRLANEPSEILADPDTLLEARTDDFQIGAFAAFLPPVISDLGGSVTAELVLRGGAGKPSLSGRVVLGEGAIALAALPGQPFRPIEASLAFTAQRIDLEALRIGEPGAAIHGRGGILLDGLELQSLDFDLDFEDFVMAAPGLVRGTLRGPLSLSGTRDAMALRGKIDLVDVRVEVPDQDSEIVKEIRVVATDSDDEGTSIREEADLSTLLEPLDVDVKMSLSRNSWARGRGAEIELRGSVDARKRRGQALGVSGSIETVRGTYEVYGRRFRVERGQAIFDGSAEPDPVLDIRALHRVRDVRIIALIEGRLSEPRLRFESEPQLSETDIASYLLLGRPAGTGSDREQQRLDGLAANIAAGLAVKEAERFFGNKLPVDLVEARVEEKNGVSEVHAGVGKYVGDRLFLYYERGFGQDPVDEFRAEYELTPNWSVESTVTGEGETAGDLVFEIDF